MVPVTVLSKIDVSKSGNIKSIIRSKTGIGRYTYIFSKTGKMVDGFINQGFSKS